APPRLNGQTAQPGGVCPAGAASGAGGARPAPGPPTLPTWLRGQAPNLVHHAQALRPVRSAEFGTTAATPTAAHVQPVRTLIRGLLGGGWKSARGVTQAVAVARRSRTPQVLVRVLALKDLAPSRVQAIEKVWDFYFELFGQRQSLYAGWLLGCDRI